MSICRPVSRSICRDVIYPIFGGRVEDVDVVLMPVTLVSGDTTAAAQTLIEGSSLAYNIVNLLLADHPRLRIRSQLTLTAASAKIQNRDFSYTYTDLSESVDLRYSQDRWYGEQSDESSIDVSSVASSIRPAIYNTTLQVFRLYSTQSTPREWVTPAPSHSDILSQPETWLGHRTQSSVVSYFGSNSYNSSRRYYFYDSTDGMVKRVTRLQTWTDLGDTEVEGVSNTELTQDITALLNNLHYSLALTANSIDADVHDIFRSVVELMGDGNTYTLYLPFNLQNAAASLLSGLTTPQTASSRTYQEGSTESIITLVDEIAGLDTWNDEITLTAKVQYLATAGDNTSWTDMGATGFQGLLRTEYTLRNLSNGRVGFRIHNNVITNNINDRLRLVINIEDSNMANVELLVPFDVESLVSAGSLPNATNATARTYREGVALAIFNVTNLISGLNSFNDVHWDSASAIIQVSTDNGVTWATHASEQDGLDTDEYTLNTDDLFANGNIGFTLHANSILSDIAHDDTTRFRMLVTLVSGVYTRFVNIPLNFRAPVSLSSLAATTTAPSRDYREGANEERYAIAGLITGISDINDVNLDAATVVVQYQATVGDNDSWTDMDATGFQGLLPTEYTIDNDIRSSVDADRGEVGFRIHPDVIEMAIQGRLRHKITLTDGS